MDVTPPDQVLAVVGPVRDWEPVEPTNGDLTLTWLTTQHAIKTVPSVDAARLDAEVEHSRWLAAHVSTPSVVVRVDRAERAWLVTERMPGVPAHRPDLHGDVGSLAEVAGTALRELHAISLDAAPTSIERGWEALQRRAAQTVAAGIEEIDEPYSRYSADELLTMWQDGRPDTEDLVVCHGDPALPNMLAHHGTFVGWVDLAGVRIADRHLDLAHAHTSIHRNLGPEAVYVFYDTYGTDPDLVRLDHYLLAKQLLP